MAEQLLAKLRARNLVVQYRKDSLPCDIEQFITLAIEDAEKQTRAEVLAACINELKQAYEEARELGFDNDSLVLSNAEDKLKNLQPAALDLEELLDKAHEAALPHAAEQLIKAFTEGGEFTVGSPLDKVMKRVEALLREVELKGRLLELKDWPGLCNGDTDSVERHAKLCVYHRAISELEKARASEGKG